MSMVNTPLMAYLIKPFILIMVALILLSLGRGLYTLITKSDNPTSNVRALTWRISLSIALFASLFLAFWMGWIQPHGLGG